LWVEGRRLRVGTGVEGLECRNVCPGGKGGGVKEEYLLRRTMKSLCNTG